MATALVNYKKLPQDIIRVSTAKVVCIEALEGDLTTCLDGESMHSQCVTLKLADKKVNFSRPRAAIRMRRRGNAAAQ